MKYLNPSDLMVCDYVFRVGYGIAEVFEVCATSVRVQLVSDGKIVTWAHSIEPMLVTAEMLEKNGFKKYHREWVRKDNYCCIIIHFAPKVKIDDEVLSDPPILLHIDGATFTINMIIEYVHELQHTLRNCGLKDVANNFKI